MILRAEFPVSQWIDTYLKEEYGIFIEWESDYKIDRRDYFDVGIKFSLSDIYGQHPNIKRFLEDFDLGSEV